MMIAIPGYQILSQIYESANSQVYRAIRSCDRVPAIIKLLKQDYPTPAELTRYKQEYEITRNLNIEGVIKAYSLEEYRRTIAIILEDFGGTSLKILKSQRKFTLSEILEIAIEVAGILGNIHTANIIHKDINPSNIVYNPTTGKVKLIDFGIATFLNRETPLLKNPPLLEGTLAYMSPEQTGRMNRSLDYRTDFYSFGVTLYELLTNQLVFNTSDATELVHCHIAKQPIPPHKVNPEIPFVVSAIVMKLLAKNPDSRYQSAWGIIADLVLCLMQLEANGAIEDIIPGENEISDKFQISQKLYGRERELETLLAAFERVAGRDGEIAQSNIHPLKSQIEMMLVMGDLGIGKSVLVQELYKQITDKHCYFITGKFELLQENIPYSAIVSALQELVQQLLTESEEKLQQWREKILAALGSNGQSIIQLIPEIELIVGTQPPEPELGGIETQNRVHLVLKNLIQVFASKDHPLAIFLDNLQWADTASLQLIKLLVTNSNTQYLFLIGTYRENEVSPIHPLIMTLDAIRREGVTVKKIILQPLELKPITQLIADSIQSDKHSVSALAELVKQKTGGNPLFVKDFLKTLAAENLIFFNWQRLSWEWDLAQIEAKGITDNEVELMQQWSHDTPMNRSDKFYLVEAERHRVSGEYVQAIEEYDRAIALAKENKAIQEEALANELAAKFYLAWGKEKIAQVYLTEAYHCYVRWGATAKVAALEKCYPQLLKSSPAGNLLTDTGMKPTVTSNSSSSGAVLDLAAVTKAAQAISGEIVLPNLLSKVMKIIIENAGAEKAFFLVEKSGHWAIAAAQGIDTDAVNAGLSMAVCLQGSSSEGHCVHLPNTIINYVARTGETVVLGNAIKEGKFTQDSYIVVHQPKSILCTPIQNQGKRIGILYLENNLTTDAFTPDRVSILRLLSSQAAISLENARLYEALENYSRTLEAKVEERTQKLQQEISDRKLLEEKLQTSERRVRAVFEAMTDIILVLDSSGNIDVMPTNTTSLYEPEFDVINYTIEQFLLDESAESWWLPIRQALETQQTVNFDYHLTVSDRVFWFTACVSPMSKDSAIWVARDISDRKLAESAIRKKNEELANTLQELKLTQQELIQSEKMAALGQLIAGVAHEVNTPLGAIRSSVENIANFLTQNLSQLPQFFQELSQERQADFLELLHKSTQQNNNLSTKEKRQFKRGLRRQLEEQALEDADTIADTLVDIGIYEDIQPFLPLLKDPDSSKILKMAYHFASVQKSTTTIKTATDRAAKVVFALKSYARYDNSGEKIPANITDGIETILTLYHNQLKHGVEVNKNYQAALPAIQCYPDELNQVWTNLIHNALQAMDYKGTLSIDVYQQDGSVRVSITDSGKGIPPEIKSKIFEPFFTTKTAGEGSGLGLDIVRKIVEKHEGKIDVDSVPGKTQFTVYLPIQ